MPKESSSEASTVASRILRRKPTEKPHISAHDYNLLLADAKMLAGSVMSQDETKGQG